jgi:mono/diheme cytochrome c family protein
MALGRHRTLVVVACLLLALLAIFGLTVWRKLSREEPAPTFATAEERFLYGSIGSEDGAGVPYWIYILLPRAFPDHVPRPGGLRAFGMPWQEGHELPIGVSQRVTRGVPRVAGNCALCHTATYRTKIDETPHFVPGGPGNTQNVQAYTRFLTSCGGDVRFNGAETLSWIDTIYHLSLLDKAVYDRFIVPRARKELVALRDRLAWSEGPGSTAWGAGRGDVNVAKYARAGLPVDGSVGLADFPAIWNLGARRGELFGWDGSAPSLRTQALDCAWSAGVRRFDRDLDERLHAITDWLKALRPPPYPLPVDARRAESGKAVFDRECASCHADVPNSRLGTLVDVAEVGTDRNRFDAWTKDAADRVNQQAERDGARSRPGLQKRNGYVAVALDGIWLRAPYLHNGSVPSLADLLEPPAQRPAVFYRGYDLYDPLRGGFVSQGPEAERVGWRYDTQARGNGNQGHLYGTALAAADKAALVEYLKTR